CGVDVSKDRLDVVVLPEGWFFSVSNDTAGWAELVARLRPLAVSTPPDATGGRYPPPRQAPGRDGCRQCGSRSALRAADLDARRRPGAGLHAHRPVARTREDEPQTDRRPRRPRTI